MDPPAEARGNGREAYIETIPFKFQNKICTCPNYYRPGKSPVHNFRYITIPDSGKVGVIVHETCRKPTNLWTYIEECENCEQLYIVKKFPDKYLLCGDCDSS